MRATWIFTAVLWIAAGCTTGPQQGDGTTPGGTQGGIIHGGGATQNPTSGARLAIELAGATNRLTLTNATASPLGYNLCHTILQRREGGSWTDVRTDEVCTMELRTLQPGGSATIDKRWPANAGTGEFRYRTRVELPLGGSGTEVVTTTFTH